MCSSSKLCFFYLILITLSSSVVVSQYHHYDKSTCNSENRDSESDHNQCNYSRNVSSSCDTFIVYRAQKGYSTLSSIAFLFNTDTATLVSYNGNNNNNISDIDQEIVVPIRCCCSATFLTFVADDVVYNVSDSSESLNSIACNTFEGLVKVKYFRDYFEGKNNSSIQVQVPLICTCPNRTDGSDYLITYPVMEHDDPGLIASKFGVSQESIRKANGLETYDAIFPGTVLFIPTNRTPVLNLLPSRDSSGSMNNVPESSSSSVSRTITFYVMFGGLVFAGIVSVSVVFGTLIYVWWLRYNRPRGLVRILSRNKLSPDFLDGILKIKQSIKYFSLDELKIATGDFSESTVLGCGVYRGKIGDCYVVIKKVNSTVEGNGIINILSNICHFNVLKLEGICEETRPNYLVLEFAENGSLSECLMNSKLAKQLTWKRRVQIIFDIAEGLHYLHYFTKPTYVHGNMNSRNILVTENWRAKISGFGSAKALMNCSGGSDSREWWFLSRMDVYAFGVIIVELLSGRDAIKNANLVKDFLVITENQDPSVYLQKLENFIDPLMGGDYPMMDVLYLALLAKGCTEDDLVNRPTMNDVLKALSNILLL